MKVTIKLTQLQSKSFEDIILLLNVINENEFLIAKKVLQQIQTTQDLCFVKLGITDAKILLGLVEKLAIVSESVQTVSEYTQILRNLQATIKQYDNKHNN